jgi:hypothetical protein
MMNRDPEFDEMASELGLPHGRIISWSKSGYRVAHPSHFVMFNATIADLWGHRLWAGDLDLSRDEAAIVELARRRGETLYVLFEADAGLYESVTVDAAPISVARDGSITLDDRYRIERDGAGRLVRSVRAVADQ